MQPKKDSYIHGVIICLKALCMLTTVCIIYSFFYSFDMTDEGYYLYFLQNAHLGLPGISQFHYIGSVFGELWDHQLLGYRFFSLALILPTSYYMALTSVNLSYPKATRQTQLFVVLLGLLSSMMYFTFIAMFNYNTLAVIGTYLWLGGLLHAWGTESGRKNIVIGIIIALGCALSTFGRPPAGIFIYGLGLMVLALSRWITGQSRWQALVSLACAYPALIVLYCITHWQYIQNSVEMLNILQGSSHNIGTTLFYYSIKLLRWAVQSFLPIYLFAYLIYCWLRSATKDGKPYTHLLQIGTVIITLALGAYFYDLYDSELYFTQRIAGGALFSLSCTIVLLCIHSLWISKIKFFRFEKPSRSIAIMLLLLGAPLLSALGNNTSLNAFATMAAGCWGVLIALFVVHITHNLKQYRFIPAYAIGVIATIVVTSLVVERYLAPRRVPALNTAHTFYTPGTSYYYANAISIQQDLARALAIIERTTERYGNHPFILSYNMPGIASILGLPTLGDPWHFDVLEEDDIRNCYAIKHSLDTSGTPKAFYFIQNRPLTDELHTCLQTLVMEGREKELIASFPIISMANHGAKALEEKTYQLYYIH